MDAMQRKRNGPSAPCPVCPGAGENTEVSTAFVITESLDRSDGVSAMIAAALVREFVVTQSAE
jgi:hypothetical protein